MSLIQKKSLRKYKQDVFVAGAQADLWVINLYNKNHYEMKINLGLILMVLYLSLQFDIGLFLPS